MIRRVTDPDEVNAVANDPTVRELMFLGMVYPQFDLDFSECMESSKATVLCDEAGFCSVFEWKAPGVYECHIMAPKAARGANMMRSAREMLAYMKERGARLVWGQPSVHNRGAICFIRRMGLKPAGFRTDPLLGEVQDFVTEDF
jgi:RimJ/RimL family protein N-acetyltransferase